MATHTPKGDLALVPFKYEKLNSDCIRLLQILPGDRKEGIRLSISNNVPYIAKPIHYHALSYCWGKANRRVPIDLDGCSFFVTRNLRRALRIIRERRPPLDQVQYIWIDAICINQQDVEEKNRQVAQMWRIYRGASTVLSWLGRAVDGDIVLFEQLRSIQQAIDDGTVRKHEGRTWVMVKADGSTTEPKSDATLIALWRCLLPADEKERELSASRMHNFLSRKYFTRVWMIPEVVQAVQLQFLVGKLSCSWDALDIFLTIIPGTVQRHNVSRISTMAIRARVENLGGSANIKGPLEQVLTCLNNLGHLQCGDIRDRIFAMLGLPFIREHDPHMTLQADYVIDADQLFIVSLSWIDAVFANGQAPEKVQHFAGIIMSALARSLEIAFVAPHHFAKWVRGHASWHCSDLPQRISVPSGKSIDCTGPIMQHLLNQVDPRSQENEGLWNGVYSSYAKPPWAMFAGEDRILGASELMAIGFDEEPLQKLSPAKRRQTKLERIFDLKKQSMHQGFKQKSVQYDAKRRGGHFLPSELKYLEELNSRQSVTAKGIEALSASIAKDEEEMRQNNELDDLSSEAKWTKYLSDNLLK
ncbi:hypothetical protein CKM354_001005700 [Cercospora kikuchii]|uniref:Heterokaryon incompatibility domain-containing protein n=1 Tax=Cercospora kikuchii TaxID=84275 RepID=A0A9P3CUL4_9PEZI|nr:uncharacterized protein CKM354_001005700 [Cercospora kikuchii]GIZ46955.1 hypothetical protein CKM354_001005700 [Cercospora kikuchii]